MVGERHGQPCTAPHLHFPFPLLPSLPPQLINSLFAAASHISRTHPPSARSVININTRLGVSVVGGHPGPHQPKGRRQRLLRRGGAGRGRSSSDHTSRRHPPDPEQRAAPTKGCAAGRHRARPLGGAARRGRPCLWHHPPLQAQPHHHVHPRLVPILLEQLRQRQRQKESLAPCAAQVPARPGRWCRRGGRSHPLHNPARRQAGYQDWVIRAGGPGPCAATHAAPCRRCKSRRARYPRCRTAAARQMPQWTGPAAPRQPWVWPGPSGRRATYRNLCRRAEEVPSRAIWIKLLPPQLAAMGGWGDVTTKRAVIKGHIFDRPPFASGGSAQAFPPKFKFQARRPSCALR